MEAFRTTPLQSPLYPFPPSSPSIIPSRSCVPGHLEYVEAAGASGGPCRMAVGEHEDAESHHVCHFLSTLSPHRAFYRGYTSRSLQEVAKKLAPNEEAAEEEATVAATINSLTQFLSNMHQEWLHAVDPALSLQMDQPLILQVCPFLSFSDSALPACHPVPLCQTSLPPGGEFMFMKPDVAGMMQLSSIIILLFSLFLFLVLKKVPATTPKNSALYRQVTSATGSI
jgi:hypothetical protein